MGYCALGFPPGGDSACSFSQAHKYADIPIFFLFLKLRGLIFHKLEPYYLYFAS
jgi:hypothetical protein